jgi:comEA protein
MKLRDEMAIVIFSKKEVENFYQTKEEVNIKVNECENKCDACIERIEDSNDKNLLNINKASINDFMSLPGIGEAKAKSIIDYRNSKGSFKSLDEIKDVKGIGESIFEKIKEYLTI